MRRAVALLAAVIGCAAFAAGNDELTGDVRAAHANGYRVEGERYVFELEGRAHIVVRRLGLNPAEIVLDADKITVVTGLTEEGEQTVLKFFAAGSVHIDGTLTDAEAARTQTVVADCLRIEYSATDEILHLIGSPEQRVTGRFVDRLDPTEENGLETPTQMSLDIDTITFDMQLRERPADEEPGPPQ